MSADIHSIGKPTTYWCSAALSCLEGLQDWVISSIHHRYGKCLQHLAAISTIEVSSPNVSSCPGVIEFQFLKSSSYQLLQNSVTLCD